jgi:hypothetical protein
MIIQFSVENFRSLKARQTISFVPDRAIKDETTHLLPCRASPTETLLPSVLVYGANASGKSALIHAVSHFRERLVMSFFADSPDVLARRYSYFAPFALDESSSAAPTTFEVDFTHRDIRHTYGFAVVGLMVIREWLHFFPKGQKARLFDRNGREIEFGEAFNELKSEISNLVASKATALALSIGAELNQAQLQDINSSLSIATLTPDRTMFFPSPDVHLARQPNKRLTQMVCVLKHLGTGIDGFERKTRKETPNDALYIPTASSRRPGEVEYVEFQHRGVARGYPLPYSEESSGTKHLIRILQAVFASLERGTLVAADELDTSLHTQAADAVVALFATREINTGGGQLLATTHNTNLMANECFRRDQLWFVEKDDIGRSELYPLTDFATRKEMNIERGYLQGRFGATPFVDRSSSISALVDDLKQIGH